MAPDLDVLIRSETDPLLAIEFHRHFTHSIAFIPFGALICACLLYPACKRTLTFRACYGFSLLGYASHGLLDACTSYGTLLFWPFSNERIAWDLISVIDPLFTIPLIGFVLLAAFRRRAVFSVIGVCWCLCYLGLGFVQNQRVATVVAGLAATRGHAPGSIETKPTFGNLLLWKTIYLHEDRYYVDAVRAGFRPRIFEGESRPILDVERDFPWLAAETHQWEDVERFRWFADGYLVLDPEVPNRILDLRYSLVPNNADGFWGIELDAQASSDAHAAYVTQRMRSTEEGRELLRMLFH